MIDAALLKDLCCPESRQPLHEADAAFVSALNQRITSGTVRTRAGRTISTPCEGALVRADGAVAYPIRGCLPILLMTEAIVLKTD